MEKRKLSEIASEIKKDWRNVSPYAKPYLDAMSAIDSSDPAAKYYLDDAETIVAYFLSNAGSWRGETARRIKKELRENYGIN